MRPLARLAGAWCAVALAGLLCGTEEGAGAAPAAVANELCVGAQHTCARRGGAVACWGDNGDHQIAASATPQFDTPRIVSELPPAASLRCGAFETCVLTAEGAVHCLGGPPRAEHLALGQPARDVILYRRGGCALLRDGGVTCWSRPATEGAGATTPIRTLRAVSGVSDGTAFVAAPAAATTVCVSRGSRAPLCFAPDGGTPAPVTDALASAAGVVMARASGAPLCAWFGGGHVTCADAGAPASGSAPVAVPPTLRVRGPLVPFDGGFCAPVATAGGERRLTCVGDQAALLSAIPANGATVAVGDDHACAIAGGAISCWGAASHGQLGGGGSYLHARPVPVPGLRDAVQLDASTLQACALRRTGEALCWGQSVDENGRVEAHFAPWSVPLPAGSTAVRAASPSAGSKRAEPMCARGPAKGGKAPSAAGWQCRSARGWKATTLPAAIAGTKLNKLSRDGRCGLDGQGHLICASMSAAGTSPGRSRALGVASKRRFREVASGLFDGGRAVVCGLTDEGRVLCFHVDDGAAAEPLADATVAALSGVTQLAAAGAGDDSVACALTGAGGVSCWGDGRFGQLGGRTPATALEAVTIAALPPAVELAVGGTFACARTAAGEVLCWGSNRDGTAPDGATGTSAVPVTVDVKWPP